jgi:hypothetical protein
MSFIEYPDWLQQPDDPPPPAPIDPAQAQENAVADNTRAEEANNSFLTANQQSLFTGPDAFYGKRGYDAVQAAPAAIDGLGLLRSGLMGGLANDAQRRRLGPMLDAQIDLAKDGIARHAAQQSLVWQRKTAHDRIALLTNEAALYHHDGDLVGSLAEAAASAARADARAGGADPESGVENASVATAQSGVLNAAIQARLDNGNTQGAWELYDQVQARLSPEHAEGLQAQLRTAQQSDAARDYVAQITPAEPAASHDEADAQHLAATGQNQADHADDPAYLKTVQHFVDAKYGLRKRALDEAAADTKRAVDQWVDTPRADGSRQTDLPPPRLWNELDFGQKTTLLARLDQNARGGAVVPVQFNPPNATPSPTDAGSPSAVSGDDRNQAVADWLMLPGSDGRLRTERPPSAIWSQLTDDQRQAVDTVLGQNAKGGDVATDPDVRDAIASGLSSRDSARRAAWARAPLYLHKPYLSTADFRSLESLQRQFSPDTGAPREGLGHPIGTLEDNVDAAIALAPGGLVGRALRFARSLLGGAENSETAQNAIAPDRSTSSTQAPAANAGGSPQPSLVSKAETAIENAVRDERPTPETSSNEETSGAKTAGTTVGVADGPSATLDDSKIPRINGRRPMNHKYAGKVHPSGVPFNEQGFPIFDSYAIASLEIENLTGDHDLDEDLANRAARLPSTPNGYTWHHVEDGKTMQLVPTWLHDEVRHTGGAAILRSGGCDP